MKQHSNITKTSPTAPPPDAPSLPHTTEPEHPAGTPNNHLGTMSSPLNTLSPPRSPTMFSRPISLVDTKMTLSSPVVSQPISDWTQRLHVTGAEPGATVFVRAAGPHPRDIAKSWPVEGGSDWIYFLPGVSLQPGDQLQARQELGGDTSAWTPTASSYPVNQSETDASKLMAVMLNTYPWECGEHVLITGAEPGAIIEVFLGATPIGYADAPLGFAQIDLTDKLTSPGPLRFGQKTPIGPGPTTTLNVQRLPLQRGTPLPAPQLGSPIHGCEDRISLKGVYDGATVVMNLSTGESYSAGADISNPTITLPTPLKWDDQNPPTATLKQVM